MGGGFASKKFSKQIASAILLLRAIFLEARTAQRRLHREDTAVNTAAKGENHE
jgi:hypothetical protein